jgi:hypothetical protein
MNNPINNPRINKIINSISKDEKVFEINRQKYEAYQLKSIDELQKIFKSKNCIYFTARSKDLNIAIFMENCYYQ